MRDFRRQREDTGVYLNYLWGVGCRHQKADVTTIRMNICLANEVLDFAAFIPNDDGLLGCHIIVGCFWMPRSYSTGECRS